MALLPISNVVKYTIEMELGDDPAAMNIFHVRHAADPPYDGGDLLQAAQDFLGLFGAAFLGELSDELTLVRCRAKDLSTTTGAESVYSDPTPAAGGTTEVSMPANVSFCISWHEEISYRGGHPRTYLAGIPRQGQSDAQHLTSSVRNAFVSDASDFLTAVETHTWPTGLGTGSLVVVHYHRHKAVLDPPEYGNLLSASGDTRIDSQRRRLKR